MAPAAVALATLAVAWIAACSSARDDEPTAAVLAKDDATAMQGSPDGGTLGAA